MPEPSRPDPEIAALRKAQFSKPMPDPYRSTSATWSLRRAQILVHGPLLAAMAVMVLVGWRLGLFFEPVAGFTASDDLVADAVLAGAFAGGCIGLAIRAHPDRPVVTRWLVACGLALHLGAALGSWPDVPVTDCGQLATPSDRGGGESGDGGGS